MSIIPNTHPARILVVDDQPLVRRGFCEILRDQPDLKVVGEAAGLTQALCLFRESPADIVTTDIGLQNGGGLELTRDLVALDPRVRVLIVSAHNDSLYAERALRAGAKGYINKHESTEMVLTALRRILEGRIYLSEQMTERMLCRTVGNGEDLGDSPIATLSDRELEVFEQIGNGVTTREIADKLHLSPKTVETYRENVKAKLNLKNATELTQHAVQWVLETMSDPLALSGERKLRNNSSPTNHSRQVALM